MIMNRNLALLRNPFFIEKFNKVLTQSKTLFKGSESRRFLRYSFSNEDPTKLDDNIDHKIIYNSSQKKLSFLEKKRQEKYDRKLREATAHVKGASVSLKYLPEYEMKAEKTTEQIQANPSNYLINLPYSLKAANDSILQSEYDEKLEDNSPKTDKIEIGELISDIPTHITGKWMNDYEKFSEEPDLNEDIETWRRDYGTPDPSVPVSQVPCGGCGALLHCQDHSIPGYLPSEIFKNCHKNDLRETICQRCHFLKNYNTALSVTVSPDIYPRLISKIKGEKALVILMADMTDLPFSLWPGILDIIGPKRPLFLVGNKVDLLRGDRKGWLDHALTCLRSCLPSSAGVNYISLISAKTGFGVEELITKLHNVWQYKGDVYLVGCTNVGKSTLFNALLQSDYCKVKAVDLIQRATTAPWPGTTINLLKFPILRPEGWRLYLRTMRLKEERKKQAAEHKLRKQQKALPEKLVRPQVVGHIGRTFSAKPPKDELEAQDNFTMTAKTKRFGLDPNDPDFSASKWLYDTPGVLHQGQILEFLTTDEISLTVPKTVIEPRTFSIRNGWTLFIAGLARIDYLKGKKNIKLTVFSSRSLPITITECSNAVEVYDKFLGSEYMQVPSGPEERLQLWPGLQSASEVTLVGIGSEESCADITLSSAGWVSITPERDEVVKMQFWTPQGRGVHVRTPSLLPKAVAFRGNRMKKSPAFGISKPYIV